MTVGGAWPLVGRDKELSAVARLLGDPASGGVVISGAAGMGKTRLAKEAVALAVRSGRVPLAVVGLKATSTLPLGAFAAFHLPAAGGEQRQVLVDAAESLVHHAGGGRLVLSVDDAHLLDPLGAALVHHVVLTRRAFLVATARTGEPAPEPIVALWKDELADRLELGSLSQVHVAQLVERVLGGYVEATTTQRLWRASGGNALFLRELILSGVGAGNLVVDAGAWRWRGPLGEGQRLTEVIEQRLGELEVGERQALELLALAEVLSASTLEHLAPASVLATLESKNLLTTAVDGRRIEVRLAHPLYGEVLRARSRLRARALAARLSDDLQTSGLRRETDLLRLATWRLDAGDPLPCDLSLAAAGKALSLADCVLAERFARSSAESTPGFASGLLLGQALSGQRRPAEAEACLASIESVAADDRQRAQAALARANNLVFNLNLADDADRVLSAAESAVHDEFWRDELALARGFFLIFRGRLLHAVAAAQPVLDRVDAGDGQRLRALVIAVTSWMLRGDMRRAIPSAEEGITLAARAGDELPLAETQLRAALAFCLSFAGRAADAAEMADVHYHRALERNDLASASTLGMSSGAGAFWRGDVRGAVRVLSGALPLLREHDAWGMHTIAVSLLAMASSTIDDRAVTEAAMAELESVPMPSGLATWAGLARSWVAAGRGETSIAPALAIRAADAAADHEFLLGEIIALHDAARFGAAGEVVERMARVGTEIVDAPLAAAFVAHAQALVAQDGGALDAVASSMADLGATLFAAEAAAEASLCHRAAGLRARSAASAERARTLADRCGRPRTPALSHLDLDGDGVLTPREREIACMAAQGLASRDIAGRLFVSVRTVDSHLSQVYAKLGVSGRSELSALIGSQ